MNKITYLLIVTLTLVCGVVFVIYYSGTPQALAPSELTETFSSSTPSDSVSTTTSTENVDTLPFNPPPNDMGDQVFCTADAKQCPDGSYVGRVAPSCSFAACPADVATTTVSISLKEGASSQGLTIMPTEVISDSRCPTDVTCIWAGTVEVQMKLSTENKEKIVTLTFNEPYTFEDYTVTLVEVVPNKTQDTLPDSVYRFVFRVFKM